MKSRNYYLVNKLLDGTFELWKKDDIEKGVDGLIATFTSLTHAEIARDTFNDISIKYN